MSTADVLSGQTTEIEVAKVGECSLENSMQDVPAKKRPLCLSPENYKVEISNLPAKMEFHMAKNLIQQHFKLKTFHKIKVGRGRVYVTFYSEADRDAAIAKINSTHWRDKILEARIALPGEDPFKKKKRIDQEDRLSFGSDVEDHDEDPGDINAKVCPLWTKDYDTQLKNKDRLMRSVLNMYKQIRAFSSSLAKDAPNLFAWNESHKDICCPFLGIERSPIINGYRNKCEFNVDRDGNVGFRLGRYKDGSAKVVSPPKDCPIVNAKMFEVISTFEKFLKDRNDTKLRGFDPVLHEGHVRQLTVRTTIDNKCLVIIDMHPQDLSEDCISREVEAVVELLRPIDGVASIFFNISEKAHLTGQDKTLRLVYGENCIRERLTIHPDVNLDFRIGPTSFFQVNTRGSEILYKTIIELANLNSKSLVIDFGCGIGTISLAVAKQVGHVIGIEIVESAVEDAKTNAQANSIQNVSFFCGKAEDLINETIHIMRRRLAEQKDEGEIVAIVDPPRVGFNPSFIKSLRASPVRKLVYVACDPKANINIHSLCRPKSKAYQGEPFVPKLAKAIDLFPHTKCCELVIVYERLDSLVQS